MEGALKGLFGGGEATPDSHAKANDFIQRVTTGDQAEGYTKDEAHAAVSHVLQNAPPATIQRAMNQSLNNMSESQRQEFAQMVQQRQAQGRPQDGSGVQIQHSSGGSAQAQRGGGLDDVLGGLLGGSGSGGGSLGGLLGGLLGGASAQTGATQGSSGGGLGGALGEIMSSPVGKAAMAGMAAFAMKEIMQK
jgi:hypothetical protein